MMWTVDRILTFPPERPLLSGLAHLGFHDWNGRYYALSYDHHWAGEVGADAVLLWSAGPEPVASSPVHIAADLHLPVFACGTADGDVLTASNGNKRVYRISPSVRSSALVIDGEAHNLTDVGNCVLDARGNIWLNEITGCRVLMFDAEGRLLRTLGTGEPGFQRGTVSFDEARFHWIYDLRCGVDGALYVLDSRNYAVRRIDPVAQTVTTVAGTGAPGYSGDGGPATEATFGGDPDAHFDGPWSLAIDEANNLYIGDTQNQVMRMVSAATGTITTIAGLHGALPGTKNDPAETDPMRLALPRIASLDYADGRLFVPDFDGELVVLRR